MPKRVVRPYRFEVETERKPLKPGTERRLRKIAMSRASNDLEEWRNATEDVERFYVIPRAAMAAYLTADYQLARELALKALELASMFKDNWNYGNAVHRGHTVLGLLALRVGDKRVAIEELRLSAEIQGSPQLNSFGPSMYLAREALRVGEFSAVLSYLQQCRQFWKMGQTWLDLWERKITRGAVPTFFMQLYK